ncbi:MAG: methylmalonyl-CoA mutase [Saprospiraceae bacterium]|jgi:methylmalonyl-CoA mutase
MKNLFSGFQPKTKAEWLAKVEKDLKGKPLDSLNWALTEALNFTPFAHAEDLENLPAPIVENRESNTWEMGARIKVVDYKIANQEALDALENGANALCFELEKTPNQEELTLLLKEIQHEWISTNFKINQASWERITANFIKLIEEKGQSLSAIACSFSFEGNNISDFEQFKNTIKKLPKGRFLTINALPFYQGKEEIVEELAQTITAANQVLVQLNNAGIDLKKAHSTIQFSMVLSDSYFLNIAKIRALKLLWQQVLKAWDESIEADSPIEIHLTTATQTEDENYNKIKATTQAMSAVIGGASRLYIYASDEFKDGKGTAFGQRIALNIQHLMQLESYFDRVVDPSAGSYYIEHLTEVLGEKTWNNFKNKI